MNETNSVSKFESSLYKMKSDQLEIVKFLQENRTEGCTEDAMKWAASYGHLEIVKFLRDIGYGDFNQ